MDKTERLQEAIRRHAIPDITAERLTASTVTTPYFAFRAFRIGNSVGDSFEIAMSYLLAQAVSEKCGVKIYTIEHCELHSKSESHEALEDLIQAAILFDSTLLDGGYRSLLKELQMDNLNRIRSIVNSRR